MRGEIVKLQRRDELQLQRNLLERRYTLQLKREFCVGCGICVTICPKEAIELRPATLVEGRLIKSPTIDFDVNLCILCGQCSVLCPLNALTMKVDGEEIATIVKNEAFPTLLKEISVVKEKCDPKCELKCQDECPREAIEVITETSRTGKILRIKDVRIDESRCIYCGRCEPACPLDAIHVRKPFSGTIKLEADLCPEGCRACIDICPSHAIQQGENGKPVVLQDFCVYCSACQQICPKEAIEVSINQVDHTDVRAAAWLTALKKLTSLDVVAKELEVKSERKRHSIIENRESYHTPVP